MTKIIFKPDSPTPTNEERTKQWVIWRDLMALINAYPRPLGAK